MSEEIANQKPTLAQFGRRGSRIATSLNLDDKENRVLMMKCLNDCDARLTEEIGEVICVTDYFVHDVQKLDEKTGEVIPLERLVVIAMDGTTHETVGKTFLESLKLVAFACGTPPWPGGVKLKVRNKKRNTRDIYWFDVVE